MKKREPLLIDHDLLDIPEAIAADQEPPLTPTEELRLRALRVVYLERDIAVWLDLEQREERVRILIATSVPDERDCRVSALEYLENCRFGRPQSVKGLRGLDVLPLEDIEETLGYALRARIPLLEAEYD